MGTNYVIQQGERILEAAINCLEADHGYGFVFVGPPGSVAGTCGELSVALVSLNSTIGGAGFPKNDLVWQVTLSQCCGEWLVQEADELGITIKIISPEEAQAQYAEQVASWWTIFSGIKEKFRLLCGDNCGSFSAIGGNPPARQGSCITGTIQIDAQITVAGCGCD